MHSPEGTAQAWLQGHVPHWSPSVWRVQACCVEVLDASQLPATQENSVSVHLRVPLSSQVDPKPPHGPHELSLSSQVVPSVLREQATSSS